MRLLLGLLLSVSCCAQMQDYIFGFLRVDPQRKELPAEELNRIQAAHLAHLGEMSKAGALMGAGPLLESPDLRGVLIFKGVTLEQALKMTSQDPTVINHRLKPDLMEWSAVPGIGDKLAAEMKSNPDFKYKMIHHTLIVYKKTAKTPAKMSDWGRPEHAKTMEGHHAFFEEMRSKGKVITAGAFQHNEFLGVWIYRSGDKAEAAEFAKSDPMVKAGYAEPVAYVWMVADGVMPANP